MNVWGGYPPGNSLMTPHTFNFLWIFGCFSPQNGTYGVSGRVEVSYALHKVLGLGLQLIAETPRSQCLNQ